MPLTKSFFQRIPFIRISSLFMTGILINHYIPIGFHWIGILLTLLISILIFRWHSNNFPGDKAQNLLISVCLLLCGIFYPNKVIEKHFPTFDKNEYFLAEVCQKPKEKAKTYQSILWIHSAILQKPEKVVAYFSKENIDTTLIPGDQLILLARPQAIKNMGNPFEFDYRQMMLNKGIYYSVYLSPGSYRTTGIRINRLSYWAEQVRDKLIALLSATKIEKEERSVISALTLGYRAELDPETLDYFVNTGTIHVLSVSGLHVALVFFILNYLFSGLNKGKFGTIIYPTLMILLLWIYAFITGFSPPVQRSTVMFTFVMIGNVLRRPINIFNSLSASALALILLDPNVLLDIGFQLSYLAIFGIVLLQPPLEKLIHYENKIMKWMWTLLTVSIAAQCTTLPLSIFYFNQFPNLFWLSNLFVIPGTTLLMWITFGFFILSPLPIISNVLAQIIQLITHLMLLILKWMSELPLAVSQGIVFNPIQTWIVYVLIASFIIYGFSKKKSWLFAGLTLIIIFQASILWTKSNQFNQKLVYVYNSKNNLIQCINGRNSYVISNGKFPVTEQEINIIQNVCHHLKLKKTAFLDLYTVDDFEATDMIIHNQGIRFLNCRINFTNLIQFNIRGADLLQFKTYNPGLLRTKFYDTSLTRGNFDNKNYFSIDFTSKSKEALFFNLK